MNELRELARTVWKDNRGWLVPTLVLLWVFLLGMDVGRLSR